MIVALKLTTKLLEVTVEPEPVVEILLVVVISPEAFIPPDVTIELGEVSTIDKLEDLKVLLL